MKISRYIPSLNHLAHIFILMTALLFIKSTSLLGQTWEQSFQINDASYSISAEVPATYTKTKYEDDVVHNVTYKFSYDDHTILIEPGIFKKDMGKIYAKYSTQELSFLMLKSIAEQSNAALQDQSPTVRKGLKGAEGFFYEEDSNNYKTSTFLADNQNWYHIQFVRQGQKPDSLLMASIWNRITITK